MRNTNRHKTLLNNLLFALGMVALVVLLAWGFTAGSLVATMVAGGGLAVAIVLIGSATTIPDNLRSQATERTLRLASQTLDLMHDEIGRAHV